jgi:hypothetical protein
MDFTKVLAVSVRQLPLMKDYQDVQMVTIGALVEFAKQLIAILRVVLEVPIIIINQVLRILIVTTLRPRLNQQHSLTKQFRLCVT